MMNRRTILRGAAALPALSLPAIAEAAVLDPQHPAILAAYREWLHMEGRMCGMELYPELGADAGRLIPATPAARFHFPPRGDWRAVPKPSTRAGLVLSSVGFDLQRIIDDWRA